MNFSISNAHNCGALTQMSNTKNCRSSTSNQWFGHIATFQLIERSLSSTSVWVGLRFPEELLCARIISGVILLNAAVKSTFVYKGVVPLFLKISLKIMTFAKKKYYDSFGEYKK